MEPQQPHQPEDQQWQPTGTQPPAPPTWDSNQQNHQQQQQHGHHHNDHEHHHHEHGEHGHHQQQYHQQWQAAQPQAAPAPVAPTPPRETPAVQAPMMPINDTLRPIPVVRVLSPYGVEYVFLTILLFFGAGALMGVLLVLVNGAAGFSALSFPTAVLTATVPCFALLFLRLKKMEMAMPQLKLDASKRRSTQFIQIAAFIVSLFALIGMLFAIFSNLGGESGVSVGKAFLDALCILVVSGGILAYYWRDEHRSR